MTFVALLSSITLIWLSWLTGLKNQLFISPLLMSAKGMWHGWQDQTCEISVLLTLSGGGVCIQMNTAKQLHMQNLLWVWVFHRVLADERKQHSFCCLKTHQDSNSVLLTLSGGGVHIQVNTVKQLHMQNLLWVWVFHRVLEDKRKQHGFCCLKTHQD